MRNKKDYYLNAVVEPLAESTAFIYRKVFRTDFSEPGFVVIDLGETFNSQQLRAAMVDLKNSLSKQHREVTGNKLAYQWMGRFDQQETTKFHLDNAADQSFLMLGYEPTVIKSKLFFADYLQYARSIDISGEDYFEKYNPMFTDSGSLLKSYITEVEGFFENRYNIVLMNNSNTSKQETIGVFHKAEILLKDTTKERVINSTMIYSEKASVEESISVQQQHDFITTDKISKR